MPRQTSLYICYFNTEESLVHTQVLPYLRAVAGGGIRVHLLTYEKRASWRKGERRRRGVLKQALAADGICWHWLKYHRRPSLAATACDILLGILYGAWLVVRHRVNVIHARAHVAGVARVLGAADPDRCDGHAVRADRPAALGAREAGFPVRVPIAGWHAAASLAACASTSPSRRPKTYRPPSES